MVEKFYSDVWDLDVFFKGGSKSQALRLHMDEVKEKIAVLEKNVRDFAVPSSGDCADNVADLIELIASTAVHIEEAGAVVGCLLAADTTDRHAVILESEIGTLDARFSTVLLKVQQILAKTDDETWQALIASDSLKQFSFKLNEWREEAALRLSEAEESMIAALSVDGYHGWSQLYDLLVGDLTVRLHVEGEEKTLSVGQANNLSAHKNAAVRKESFEELEKVWEEKEDFFTSALNHIAGFRLAVYEKRGWDSVLKEPLFMNRMSEQTLQAMWSAIRANQAPFVRYLNKKANILGTEKIHWYDIGAPVTTSMQKISYQEGAEFILHHFGEFGETFETFSRNAFEDRWIEAEDRSNKRPGGLY